MQDLCTHKPGRNYTFAHDQDIYNASRITLSGAQMSNGTLRPTSPAPSLSVAAIVGLVLGGLIFIALLLAGLLFFLHRRKDRSKAEDIVVKDISTIQDHGDYFGQQTGVAYTLNTAADERKGVYVHMAPQSSNVESPAELAARRSMMELPANHVDPYSKKEKDHGI